MMWRNLKKELANCAYHDAKWEVEWQSGLALDKKWENKSCHAVLVAHDSSWAAVQWCKYMEAEDKRRHLHTIKI